MSDQGDAGQWRPATSQSDQYSTPDETTGPLPAISGDEADAPGFPSVSEPRGSWSADDDDDAQTGGVPAVPPAPAEEPPAPVERSVFDPVERTDPPYGSSEVADPGPNGTTPRFGTDVPDPDPAPDPGESSFGSFGDSYGLSSKPDRNEESRKDPNEDSEEDSPGLPDSLESYDDPYESEPKDVEPKEDPKEDSLELELGLDGPNDESPNDPKDDSPGSGAGSGSGTSVPKRGVVPFGPGSATSDDPYGGSVRSTGSKTG